MEQPFYPDDELEVVNPFGWNLPVGKRYICVACEWIGGEFRWFVGVQGVAGGSCCIRYDLFKAVGPKTRADDIDQYLNE